jgi:esterase/lipase
MDKQTSTALGSGLTDAAGFLIGTSAGALLAKLLGFDFLNQPGYDTSVIIGIAMVGLGGGLGVKLARTWRAKQIAKQSSK